MFSQLVNLFRDALGFLGQVPAAFWGVICGSFFSILGVALTNRASTDRLEIQFAHERRLKTKERELALKKEIFLEAAEAVSVALNAITNIADLNMPNEKVMEEYRKKAPAFAKIQLVGSTQTVEALLEFTGDWSAKTLSLFAIRHKLMLERNAIGALDSQNLLFSKEADRYLELQKQYNLSLTNDPQKWHVLQSGFDFEQQRSVDGNNTRQALAGKLGAKHLQLIGSCSQAVIDISPLIVPLLIAAREELELPFNGEIYKGNVEKSLSKQRLRMEQYLGEVASAFGQKVAAGKPADVST